MARPIRFVMGALSDDADGICEAQTPVGAGNMTLDGALVSGGSVTLSYGQLISIVSDGNESGLTFTITGTDPDGNAQTEAIAGPNIGTSTGTKWFKTITQIAVDGAGAGNITIGVLDADGGVSKSIPLNVYGNEFNVGLQFNLTAGTMTAHVDYTMDDPQRTTYTNGFFQDAVWSATGVASKTADFATSHTVRSTALRLRQTANSAGACELIILQAAG